MPLCQRRFCRHLQSFCLSRPFLPLLRSFCPQLCGILSLSYALYPTSLAGVFVHIFPLFLSSTLGIFVHIFRTFCRHVMPQKPVFIGYSLVLKKEIKLLFINKYKQTRGFCRQKTLSSRSTISLFKDKIDQFIHADTMRLCFCTKISVITRRDKPVFTYAFWLFMNQD